MSTLRVNKITNSTGSGPPSFTKGITFPSNVSFADTSVSSTLIGIAISAPTGIMTATNLVATQITVQGVCTATSFSGIAGPIGLTNLPGTPNGKAIALTLVT